MNKQASQNAVDTPDKRRFRNKRSRYPHDTTVTEDMYREVMQLYPPLQKSRAYRNFFSYIALGPHYVDRDSGYTLLPARFLASFEGKLGQYYAHRYSAEAFLKSYRRDVYPAFRWSRWSKQDKKARALIANYLHGLPLSMFKRQVAKHYREAMDYAIEHGDVQDIMTLKGIRDMPMPLYHVDPPNARLFPSQGLATMKREIRHILLQEWAELDLVNCKAAIVGGIWHIDSVNAVLGSGHSIWELCSMS